MNQYLSIKTPSESAIQKKQLFDMQCAAYNDIFILPSLIPPIIQRTISHNFGYFQLKKDRSVLFFEMNIFESRDSTSYYCETTFARVQLPQHRKFRKPKCFIREVNYFYITFFLLAVKFYNSPNIFFEYVIKKFISHYPTTLTFLCPP